MHIVALGSSFAAGPSIPPQTHAAARRSSNNYASLLSRGIPGSKLTDLSASGATLLNVLNEPQETLLATLPLFATVFAQDGSVTGPTSSASAAGYSCDASKCKLPNCNCASTDPPGGLDPVSFSRSFCPPFDCPRICCFLLAAFCILY